MICLWPGLWLCLHFWWVPSPPHLFVCVETSTFSHWLRLNCCDCFSFWIKYCRPQMCTRMYERWRFVVLWRGLRHCIQQSRISVVTQAGCSLLKGPHHRKLTFLHFFEKKRVRYSLQLLLKFQNILPSAHFLWCNKNLNTFTCVCLFSVQQVKSYMPDCFLNNSQYMASNQKRGH